MNVQAILPINSCVSVETLFYQYQHQTRLISVWTKSNESCGFWCPPYWCWGISDFCLCTTSRQSQQILISSLAATISSVIWPLALIIHYFLCLAATRFNNDLRHMKQLKQMGEEMAEICMKADYLLYRTQWHTEVLALNHRLHKSTEDQWAKLPPRTVNSPLCMGLWSTFLPPHSSIQQNSLSQREV